MLSFPQALIDTLSADPVEHRVQVVLWTDASTSHEFWSGVITNASVEGEGVVKSVSAVKRGLDPINRIMDASEVQIELALDTRVRSLIVNNNITNKHVTVALTTSGLGGSEQTIFAGLVKKYIPTDTTVQLSVMAVDMMPKDRMVVGEWNNMHPLEAALEIIQLAVPAARVDTSAFTPSAYSDIDHWVVSNGGTYDYDGGGAQQDRNAKALLDGLAVLLDGSFYTDISGQFSFKKFDSSDSVVATFEENDLQSFKVNDVASRVINRCIVKSHFLERIVHASMKDIGTAGTAVEYEVQAGRTHRRDDATSQTDFAHYEPGGAGTVGRQTKTIASEWLNSFARLGSTIGAGDGAGATFTVYGRVESFCGSNFTGTFPGSITQPAWAAVSAATPLYLMCENGEIIAVDAVTVNDTTWSKAEEGDIFVPTSNDWPYAITCQINARGALGTSGKTIEQTNRQIMVDVTIPVAIAQAKIDRWANYSWEVEARLGLRWAALEEGDFVSFVTDKFVAKDMDGLDANTKFEIIDKQVHLGEDPHVLIRAIYALTTSPPATSETPAWVAGFQKTGFAQNSDSAINQDVGQTHVVDGFDWANESGLQADITAGTCSTLVGRSEMTNDVTHTFTDNKDTYVAFDPTIRGLLFFEVATGAGQPSGAPAYIVWLWEAAALAGVITQTDLRETQAIPGTVLKAGTGPLTHLDSTGILDNLTSISTRDFSDINDDGAFRKVVSVDINGRIRTNSIASGEVVDSHIDAAAAIQGSKLLQGSGPLTHLSAAGALDNLTSITARSFDNITDGATYKKVTGVSAVNKIQSASITAGAVDNAAIGALAVDTAELAAEAVTEPKVGDDEIGLQHFATDFESGVGVISNPGFTLFTRG